MSPRVMAQVQLHLLLPERSSGCGTHGCFGACRGLVPGTLCHGCEVEWALDKGKTQSVYLC